MNSDEKKRTINVVLNHLPTITDDEDETIPDLKLAEKIDDSAFQSRQGESTLIRSNEAKLLLDPYSTNRISTPTKRNKQKISKSPCRGEEMIPKNSISPPIAFEEGMMAGLRNCLMVAGRGEMNRFVLFIYLKQLGTWSSSQHIPTFALQKRCFVNNREYMYFIGGEEITPEMKLDALYKYNLRTGNLTPGPSLRVPRCEAGAVVWKNTIYVMGGLNRLNKPMTHVEAYDIYLNSWRLLHPMKYKRHGSGITVMNGTLYMIGGYTVRCECYNLEYAFAWIEVPELPHFCKDFSMVATNNDGCVIAMRTFKPDRVCILDLIEGSWKVTRTSGMAPENIQDACKCCEELYVVDTRGRIFVLNLKALTWDLAITCPKSFRVFHIGSINFDDLRKTPDKVTRDFE